MFKKNLQKRFHTAGARIIRNGLPVDFFKYSLNKQPKPLEYRSASKEKPEHQRFLTPLSRNPKRFTFHRSSSHQQLGNQMVLQDEPQIAFREESKPSREETHLPPVRSWVQKQNNFLASTPKRKLNRVSNKVLTTQQRCSGDALMLSKL